MITRAPSPLLKILVAFGLFSMPLLAFAIAGPGIVSFSPSSGPTSTQVTVTGSGFDTDNYVLFGGRVASNSISAPNQNTLIFYVPLTTVAACTIFNTNTNGCGQDPQSITPGTYNVQIENAQGTSNGMSFNVTPSGSSSGTGATGSTGSGATGAGSLSILAPADQSAVSSGSTIDIDFTASGLSTPYANVELLQNGAPLVQISTVNMVAGQSNYTVSWTVPTLTDGAYDLVVADGASGTTGASTSVTLNVNSTAATTTLINIDPNDVVFNASTGTYTYTDPAEEAQFEQEVAALGGSNSNNTSQTNAAVGIVGDALVNSAGQCVGISLAKQISSALPNLFGAAAVTPTAIPTNNVPITAKEIAQAPGAPSLDSIGYCIGNAMLQTLANSVTQWINNDFQLPDGSTGSAYLKNPAQFFQNLSNVTASAFLSNFTVNGANLCSNFSLPLKLNLLQQYSTSYNQRASCTLAGVVNNLSAFTGGDFSQGGWSGWLSMTQNPSNNYYGSYAQAATQMQFNISQAQSSAKTQLQQGNGFMSYQKCVAYAPNPPVVNGKTVPKCTSYQTITPGSLVAAAALGTQNNAQERLIVSNSFDQVVTALITAMVTRLTNFAGSQTSGLGL